MSLDAPPLTPDADTARRWAVEELAKDEYREGGRSWLDTVTQWISDLVERILGGLGPGDGGGLDAVGTVVAGLLVVAVVSLVLWLVVGPMRRSRAHGEASAMFDDDRSAAELERAARGSASAGDWAAATLDGYRALIAHLAERDLITLTAGLTAAEAAAQGAAALSAIGDRLAVDAEAFNGIRYGHVDATQATWEHVRETLMRCREARPRLAVPEGAS